MSQRFSLYEDLTVRENIRSTAASTISPTREIRERTDAHARAPRPRARARATSCARSRSAGGRSSRSRSRCCTSRTIVFLDEPTSGVDPITRRQFWELIYEAARGGHDRARDDALHGRSRVLRPHLDHGRGRIGAMGTPAELKQQFGVESIDEVFVRLARPASENRQERAR